MTVFDVQEKRSEWKETITPEMVEHLVFLDESGVNTDLTRLYGRALSSQRAVDHAPLNTPQTTTVLSSIRLDGEKAFTTYQGGTTAWGRTGHKTGRDSTKWDWPSYYNFMNNQLTELLTNYGPVGAIWFDGKWDQDQNPSFDWQLPEQYALIHSLQPACLIGNNHHETPYPGEDIQIFERDLPGENKAGLSGQSVADHLPLETCETMNGMWGYKFMDQN